MVRSPVSALLPRLFGEAGEQLERLTRREIIHVYLLQLLDYRVRRREAEERELFHCFLLSAFRFRPPPYEVSSLEQAQHRTRTLQDRLGKPGEAPHFDTVRSVGAAGLELVEEEDLVTDLAHGDVIVTNCY
jgi:hypothetical protein